MIGTRFRGRLALVGVLVLVAGGCAWLERSSVSSAPANVTGNGASRSVSVSASGRFVAFASDADNLVPNDTNGVTDVFVRDNLARVTERVSLTATGGQADGASTGPSISDDGRFVAFASTADNMVAADPDLESDVFVRDRTAATTSLVSVTADGGRFLPPARDPLISGDGGTVAFESRQYFADSPVQIRNGPFVRELAAPGTTYLGWSPTSPIPGAFTALSDFDLSGDGSLLVMSEVDGNVGSDTGTVRTRVVRADGPPVGPFGDPVAIGQGVGQGIVTGTSFVDVAISGDGSRVVLGVRTAAGTGLTLFLTAPVADLDDRDGDFAIRGARDLQLSDDGTRLGIRTDIGDFIVGAVMSPFGGPFDIVSEDREGTTAVTASSLALSGDGRWAAFTSADDGLAPDGNGFAQAYTRSVGVSGSGPG